MKSTGKRILGALLALCVAMGLMGILPLVASSAFVIVDITITNALSVAQIQTTIQNTLDQAGEGSVITVVGAKTDADVPLGLSIPEGVEIIWKAVYTNAVAVPLEGETAPTELITVNPLINLAGAGKFEVAAPANIANSSGWAIMNNVDVLVSGGAVASTADDCGAISADKAVKVTGGAVSGDRAIDGIAVEVTGGTVAGKAFAIQAEGAVTVSGGNVTGITGIAAKGAVAVSGGNVSGTYRAIETKNSSVVISGGTVSSDAVAIDAANTTTSDVFRVTVTGGSVIGKTTGIVTKGEFNVVVSGGAVSAGNGTFDRAIALDIGTVKVSGGTVTGKAAIDNLGQFGAVAYKAGTVFGEIKIKSVGMVVKVTTDNIPGAFEGTTNGLVIDQATYKATAAWKFSGNDPSIAFALPSGTVTYIPAIPWGTIVLPVITNASVSRAAGAAGETAGTLSFNSAVDGELYALFLAPGAAAPEVQQILAAPLLANVPAGAVNLPLVFTYEAKDIFFVVKDALGNLSNEGVPVKVSQAAFALQYTLTVVNGTGGGKYAPGELATFSTTVPAKKVFVGWTATNSVPIADADQLEASLIMPGNNVTVTAVFEDEPVIVPNPEPKYVHFFKWNTAYESTVWNWFRFICLFGWIWMWF